jgi:hypothetical protein
VGAYRDVVGAARRPTGPGWYAAEAAHHGWTRAVLRRQITTRLHIRDAAAPTNFAGALDRPDSELAQQITRDPYALDFLAVDGDAPERQLEERLVDRIVALASTSQPVAVSRYELAEEAQAALPDEATIVKAFSRELARGTDTD